MKTFLIKIVLFIGLVTMLLFFSLLLVPDTLSSKNMLGALIDKHELLEKTRSPKIIFAGGSNVSFGLNSAVIADSFNRPVVNTAVHGGLGLKYIMDDCLPYVNEGDVVVLIPEYENYYTTNFYGEVELVAVLFEIDNRGKEHISGRQWLHLLPYMATYSAKKLKNFILSPFSKTVASPEITIYDRRSFNQYGDAWLHWDLPNQNYLHCKRSCGSEKPDPNVISYIRNFKARVEKKGATLVLLPPVMDASSFANQLEIINKIDETLKKHSLHFSGAPGRYAFPDSLFFNSYYHLNKQGVDLRTKLAAEDLKAALAAKAR